MAALIQTVLYKATAILVEVELPVQLLLEVLSSSDMGHSCQQKDKQTRLIYSGQNYLNCKFIHNSNCSCNLGCSSLGICSIQSLLTETVMFKMACIITKLFQKSKRILSRTGFYKWNTKTSPKSSIRNKMFRN